MWQKLYAPGARKGNRNWIARGEDAHGVRYEVDLRTANERAAGRRARKYEAKRNSRPPEAPVEAPAVEPVIHTYRDAMERYIDWRRPSEVDLDRHAKVAAFHLEDGRRIADLDIAACGQDEMVQFARSSFPGCKASTLNREALRPLAAVVHYAHRPLRWCSWVQFIAFVEDEVERTPATADQVALLIANAERSYKPGGPEKDANAPYKRALLLFLWERGLRITDVVSLRRERDLDLLGGRVRITIGKARGKVKWLPLSVELVAEMANLPPCDGDRVFPWTTKSGVYKWLRPLCRRLGIAFTPHLTRHALATEMLDADVDMKVVQELGGWASYESVRRTYQHVRAGKLVEADARRRSVGKPVGRKT